MEELPRAASPNLSPTGPLPGEPAQPPTTEGPQIVVPELVASPSQSPAGQSLPAAAERPYWGSPHPDERRRPPMEPGYWTTRATRLFVLAVVLSLAWVVPTTVERIQYAITRGQQQAKADVARRNLSSVSSSLTATSEAFRWVAQSLEPSVVHVDAMRKPRQNRNHPQDEWSLLSPPRFSKGEGSGVIVDDAGYILTNYHVIGGADRIDVHLADGRTYNDAKVVGSDPLTDLAVLKIEAGDLRAAPWGNSDELEVGDWVLAVGNPFGLDRSVTAGIISAKRERGVINDNPHQHFLQTDAAVNPGNSGGPLVNLRGEIVGINTQIVGQSFQGVSFAIPSQLARDVYQRLRDDGRVARGWLGVAQRELTADLAKSLGLEEPHGSLVTEVWPNSPAAAAGITAGDVIQKWNGRSVASPLELSQMVAATAIGQEVPIELWRDGAVVTLEVRVVERSDERLRRRP